MDRKIRTPVREKARQIVELLRTEHPDYNYLRELFRHLRKEFAVVIPTSALTKRQLPSEDDLSLFLGILDNENNTKNKIIINTLLYTGVRVSELVNIKIEDINFEKYQIQIQKGYKEKKRIVLFPVAFKKDLENHALGIEKVGGTYLFESTWKKPYTDRGIRKILATYSKKAGMENTVSPNTLRTFFLSWLKRQGVDDAMLQLYSGIESRDSLASYEENAPPNIEDVQKRYQTAIQKLPF